MAPKTHPNDDPTADTASPPPDATVMQADASAPADETSTASTS